MRRLSIIFICTIFLSFSSCYEPIPGSGNIVRQEQAVFGVINSITLLNNAKVYITAGSPQKVELEVDDNFIDNIIIKVNNKKLTISSKGIISPTVLNLYITIADIAELINKGSGKIIIQNNFNQGSNLWLTVSGSGNIEINNFNATECNLSNSGSGNIIANTGTINIGEYYLSGSGNVNFSSVINTNVIAKNSGSGKILVNVTDNLNATITGSGNIEYWGNPLDVTQNITGSGKLIKRN
ncbi:MAG: head GIN domain-containing protein [bacterium]